MRGRYGGALALLAMLASCMTVAPAFAGESTAEAVPDTVISMRNPVAVKAVTADTVVKSDSVIRVMVLEARAAVLAIRHDTVDVEKVDSVFAVVRLVKAPPNPQLRRQLSSHPAPDRTFAKSLASIRQRV